MVEEGVGLGLKNRNLVSKGPLVDGLGDVNVLHAESQTESHEAGILLTKNIEGSRRWKQEAVLNGYKNPLDSFENIGKT